MNNFLLFGIIGCAFLFVSGLITGYALIRQKYQALVQKFDILKSDHESVNNKLRDIKKEYEASAKRNENIADGFETLKKKYLLQQKEIQQLSKASLEKHTIDEENYTLKSNVTRFSGQVNVLQGEIRLLKMQVDAKQKKIIELEKYRPYHGKFVELSKVAVKLHDYNLQLKKEVTALKSAASAREQFAKRKTPFVLNTEDGVTSVYNAILKSTASQKNYRGAVIADEMGFPIASSSDFSDELAGISVLYQYCDNIINKNITFNRLMKIVFVNSDNLCLTIVPLVINGQTVYYSGLSYGQMNFKSSSNKVTEAIVIN